MSQTQKERGRSRRKPVRTHNWRALRQFMAFFLTLSMILGNIGSSASIAMAAQSSVKEEFRLRAEDIQKAAEEALSEGSPVTDALDIGGKDKSAVKDYEELLAADGSLYEIFPTIETVRDVDGIELRVFIRIDEDADPASYVLTGDEKLIFLYVNGGDEMVAARVNVDGYVSNFITVRSYGSMYGQEELPAQTPAAPEGGAAGGSGGASGGSGSSGGNVSDGSAGSSADGNETAGDMSDGTAGDAAGTIGDEETAGAADDETQAPAEESGAASDETAGVDEETSGAADESTGADSETTDAADESIASDDETTDAADESTASDDETAASDNETAADNETTGDETTGAEDETDGTVDETVGAADDESKAPEEESGAADDESEAASDKETDVSSDKDTEDTADDSDKSSDDADDKMEADSSKDDAANDANESSKNDDKDTSKDVNSQDKADDSAAKETASAGLSMSLNSIRKVAAGLASDSNAGSGAGGSGSSGTGSSGAGSSSASDDEDDDYQPGDPYDADDAVDEEEESFDKVASLSGRTYGVATLDDAMTIRAFTVSLSKLGVDTEELAEAGHTITYIIDPKGAASLVKAPELVKDEAVVTFGVKPQIGYEIMQVTANGEELELADEAALASASNADSDAVYYTIPEVLEDQEVEIVLYEIEEGSHPEFNASEKINGVTITVSAEEGILPAGTKLDVKEVTTQIEDAVKEKVESEAEDGTTVTSVIAYDINLMYNGEKLDNSWSEQGYVNVTFSGSRIEKMTDEASKVEVMAVDDSQQETLSAKNAKAVTAETVELESITEQDVEGTAVNAVSFDVEHFTIYAITGSTTQAVHTYYFYNGEELVNKQIVKNGEKLVEPQIPTDAENNKFLGWYSEGSDDAFQGFGTVTVAESEEVNLYARFAHVYYVFFYHNGVIQQMKQANTGENIGVMDVNVPVAADEALIGWTLEDSDTLVGDAVTVENSDINLYPVIKKVNWITYFANGGSYTKPTYVTAGQIPVKPEEPTKPGYTFDGWYTDQGFRNEFTFNSAIESDINLYAKWAPKTNTSYTVIHWKENADDSEYAFAESEVLTGKTGDTTNASAKNYSGFESPTVEQKVISGDGSTIVNIYYKRKVYEVKFYEKQSWWSGSWNVIDKLTIRAKYEANISQLWPSVRYEDEYGPNWKIDPKSSTMQASIDIMPLNGDNFYETSNSGKKIGRAHV